MAIRVLSGVIKCASPKAFVRIGFNPHQVLEIDPNSSATSVVERSSVGPNRNFLRTPTKHIALRQIAFQRKHGAVNFGEDIVEELVVNDTITSTELRVSWDAAVDITKDFSRVIPIEISYMIIGEVADS